MARITCTTAPDFHGTFLFAAHAVKPLRRTQRSEHAVLGRGRSKQYTVGFQEEIVQAEFGEVLVEPREIATFRKPHAHGLTAESTLERPHRHIQLHANRCRIALVGRQERVRAHASEQVQLSGFFKFQEFCQQIAMDAVFPQVN